MKSNHDFSLFGYLRAHKANCFNIYSSFLETICTLQQKRREWLEFVTTIPASLINFCWNFYAAGNTLRIFLTLYGHYVLCVSLINNQCIECENIYDVMPSREFLRPCNSGPMYVSIGIFIAMCVTQYCLIFFLLQFPWEEISCIAIEIR